MRTRLSNAHFFQKISDKVLGFLQEGVSPEKLALALAFGVCIGLMPLLGATTLICVGIAFIFRLNMPFLQLVNYLMYPLQLIFYIPFLKIGSDLFSREQFNYSLEEVSQMLAQHFWNTLARFFFINLYGVLLWLLVAPPLFVAVYFIGKGVFKLLAKRFLQEQ